MENIIELDGKKYQLTLTEIKPEEKKEFTFSGFIEALKVAEVPYPALKPVLLAQMILETGRGSSNLFKKYANPTGMKYRAEMQGYAKSIRYKAHDGYDEYCGFTDYSEAIKGYFKFITRSPYAGFKKYTNAPEAFLSHIAETWAPKQNYFNKVMSVMAEAEDLLGIKIEKPAKSSVFDNVIVLERGHGGGEFGAESKYTHYNEWDLNGFGLYACEGYLRSIGYKHVICTDDNMRIFDIGYKYAKLCDVFVSFHHNAANAEAQGTECLWYKYGNDDDKKLANMIAAEMSDATGLFNRNKYDKARNLGILRGATKARFEGKDLRGLDAAVLPELYFMDAKVEDYKELSEKCGVAIGKAIHKFLLERV